MAPRPLDGIRVVSLEHAIAAPFCTRQLADHGARVIKIERPGVGDFARAYDTRARGLSSHFVWANRSKESLSLDLKKKEALGVLSSLLEHTDVLVQNLAPGATKRLGLGYEELSSRYPRLIQCDISGFGDGGPYSHRKAYDLLIQSESGFLSITGTEDEPSKAGCSVADIAAGMYAFSGILSALLLRERTGIGSRVEISMFEAMVEWMGYPLYFALDGQPPPRRCGAAHATIFPYGPFPSGDGPTIMLGLQNEREWRIFCDVVLQRSELGEDPRFSSNSKRAAARDVVVTAINDVFRHLSAEAIERRLEVAGIAYARLNELPDVWTHSQLAARQRWSEVETPNGRLPSFLPPGVPEGVTARMDPVPALGEHTDQILAELGYDSCTIADLRSGRAI